MAAQVEVKSGEMPGGDMKPATGPKPRLTPKPFSLEQSLAMRSILAPRPFLQAKHSPLSTTTSSSISSTEPPQPNQINQGLINTPQTELENILQPTVDSKCQTESTDQSESSSCVQSEPVTHVGQEDISQRDEEPKSTSVLESIPQINLPSISHSNKKTEEASSNQPLSELESPPNSFVKHSSQEEQTVLSVSERVKKLLQAGVGQDEGQQTVKRDGPRPRSGVSINRAKSMGFIDRVWREEEREKRRGESPSKENLTATNSLQSRGTMPISVGSPLNVPPGQSPGSSGTTPTIPWKERCTTSPTLQSLDNKEVKKTESIPKSSTAIQGGILDSPAGPAELECQFKPITPEASSLQENEEEKAGSSIKKRISLLFESSSPWKGGICGTEVATDTDAVVDVKQRIKQLWSEPPPPQTLSQRPIYKPRPLSQDLTKCFSGGNGRRSHSSLEKEVIKIHSAGDSELLQKAGLTEEARRDGAKNLIKEAKELLTKGTSSEDKTRRPGTLAKTEDKDAPLQSIQAEQSLKCLPTFTEEKVPLVQLEAKAPTLHHSPHAMVSDTLAEDDQENKNVQPDVVVLNEKQVKLEREFQKEACMQKQIEVERLREAHRQKQIEFEKKMEVERLKIIELEKQREAERLKQIELEKQREAERLKQIELEKEREAERQKQIELEKQREAERLKQIELEKQREAERLKQIELEKQREAERLKQIELEKQREAERLKQTELEKQREAERQKQIELEKEREAERLKQIELEKQREAERQKQIELERQREAERLKQIELEKQREAERLKQIELERQREAERQKQIELEKQREAERQKQIELEKQREAERRKQIELEKQREAERQKQIELEKQREAERQKQIELEKQREAERLKQIELEKQREAERLKQIELEKQRAAERLKQIELERQREAERQKQIELEKEREAERLKQIELEKQREAERLKQIELEKQREAERQKQIELERQREAERLKQIELEKQREAERLKQIELERQREAERQKQIELEKQREAERQKQIELEKQREAERQKQIELEKQREAERQKQIELEKQREAERQKQIELEKQREAERQKQIELEKQREAERLKQIELEKQREAERLKQIELEKQREGERLKQIELERQREAERQKQIELEKEREAERLKQIELEKQREAERQKQIELEKQREAERQKQIELERQREAERLKQIELEKQREAERLKQIELERQREAERQKQIELEKEREAERLKQIELEKQREAERLKQIELERQRQAERLKQIDLEKQREAERQKQIELEKQSEAEMQKQLELHTEEQTQGENTSLEVTFDDFSVQSRCWGFSRLLKDSPKDTTLQDIDSDVKDTRFDETFGVQGRRRWGQGTKDVAERENGEETNKTNTESHEELNEVQKQEAECPGNYQNLNGKGLLTKERATDKEIPSNLCVEQDFLHKESVKQDISLVSGRNALEKPSSMAKKPVIDQILQTGDDTTTLATITEKDPSQKQCQLISPKKSELPKCPLEGPLDRVRTHSTSGKTEEQLNNSCSQVQGDTDRLIQELTSTGNVSPDGPKANGSLTLVAPSLDGDPSSALQVSASVEEAPSPDNLDSPSFASPEPEEEEDEEEEPIAFPETPTCLLDSSALRSRVQLGKRRSRRTPPTREARLKAALSTEVDVPEPEWKFIDSTDKKTKSLQESSDSEDEKKQTEPYLPPTQPQRVPMFPGMDPSALKAQLKKRAETESQTEATSTPRSSKSPFLPQAARVLPPVSDKENGDSSPKWLLNLKSKKRLSQIESDT